MCKTLIKSILNIFLLISLCLSQEPVPYSSIAYPLMRVMCTDDVQQISDTNARFSIVQPLSFGSGQPWASYPQRKGFAEAIKKAKAFTDKGHQKGYTYISYISKTISGGPTPDELPLVKVYKENRWQEYEDYFGPKPPESPKDWIEKRADGSLGGYTWVSPSGVAGFHSFACANNPYFHRYMQGVVKALVDMGIDGFYLDHTEGKGCYCQYCDDGFRKFLKTNYPQDFVNKKYNLADMSGIKLPKSDKDPLWIEWRKYISQSQVLLHQILKDKATELGDEDFIVSGNLFGAGGFGFAALNGSDIEMAGDIDVILYSEIVSSTTNKEEAYLTIPGFRDNMRISNSPLYKHMVFAHNQEPVLVYPYYPESPNPVATEAALYNTQRLIVAECFANRTSMRRVQHNHAKPVIEGSKNVYAMLENIESAMHDARLYSNVAVLASLNQFYHGYYSYFYSASRMLNDAGISHIMITEKELAPANMEKLDVIIIPYTPLLSNETESRLGAFVEKGGTLVMVGAAGLKDQFGMEKEKTALMSHFAGWESATTPVNKKLGKGQIIFLPVDEDKMNQFSDLLQTYNNDESEGYTISIYQHKVFGWGQFHEHLKDTWVQSRELLLKKNGDNFTGRISTGDKAELTTMISQDKQKLFAHVINYQVAEDGRITPLKSTQVSLKIPKNRKVEKVSFCSVASPVPVQTEHEIIDHDGFQVVSFTANNLELYGIAIVELN